MMGNRKQPFGYKMSLGEIVIQESEAKLVQEIFLRYIAGESLNELTESLRQQDIPYDEGRLWNKNMVARILADTRYTGEKGYPKLIDEEQLIAANEKRSNKPQLPKKTEAQKVLRRLCGTPPSEQVEQSVTDLLNGLANCPDRIRHQRSPTPATHSKTQEALDNTLEQQPIDEDSAKVLILRLAAEQYAALGNEEYETNRLRRLFSAFECVAELNADLLKNTVSEVLVTRQNVKLRLKKWPNHRKERPAMKDDAPRVIKIPAKPETTRQAEARRQLRVAAYCRVSTKEEDQANSYEVQKEYYTDKIMSNTAWTMAGIFADKGITGTSAKKREDFMRMIRHCRQKKIDVILTKSVSRFSRNTVDCLYYIRALKQLGIAVIFEKENINSLEEDSELRITLSGAFAQSESESISANVTWGKRRAMEAGKVSIQYKKLYGYRKGEDGQPEIIPEQAEIVRWLYERYLTGASLRMIKDELEQQGVKCFEDSPEWTISRIRSILQNEKYCGDVLMQKTFRQDFINRKAIKNTGQLPMYLIENHHEGIVSREKYDAVQAEMARRNAAKSPSKNAVTGMASYASKYALSERLVCGECGTLYRRCTWTRNGEKRVVWRCVSRLDYGKKYCHNSPTLDEAPLQQAILAVLNTAMADKNSLIRQITAAMETELIPFPGGTMSLGDIECRLRVLEQQFQTLLEKATDDPAAYGGQFKEILDEQTFLKEKRSVILANNNEQTKANQRIMDAAQTLENASPYITEWDESAVRQLVETVKILSKDEVAVTLKGGIEICQKIMY